MVIPDINGDWKGIIFFGESYGNEAGEQLGFELVLQQENHKIEGIATDTEGWGASPDPASVFGTFNGRKLTFIKQYLTRHFYVGEQMFIDDTQLGPEIYYSGKYNKHNDTFAGEWAFRVAKKSLGFIPYYTTEGDGTWTMQRK